VTKPELSITTPQPLKSLKIKESYGMSNAPVLWCFGVSPNFKDSGIKLKDEKQYKKFFKAVKNS
jgi:hypothetical protein